MKKMNNKNQGFTGREYYLLVILAVSALFMAGWHFKGTALYHDIARLRLEHTLLQEEQASLLAVIHDRESIEAEWPVLLREQERLAKRIPCLSELPLVLGNLEALLDNYAVEIRSLRIGEVIWREDHFAVALALELSGEPFRLQALLQNLERFPHLTLFERIRWSGSGGQGVGLELNLQLIFAREE